MTTRKESSGRLARGARLLAGIASRDALRTAGRWALRLCIAVAAVLALWGSILLEERVRGDERFYLDNWQLEIGALPDWVTPEIRDEIESIRLPTAPRRLSLFDAGVLDRVRESLQGSPWILKVGDIRARYPSFARPGILEVQVYIRRPIALVEQGGLYYLADVEGRRLGAPYRQPPTRWFKIPAITGIPSPGLLPAEGDCWSSRDVLQGIEVARILFQGGIHQDFPGRPIQAIDLANLHGALQPRESEIMLWSSGQRLAWGRSPISSGARTIPVKDIIANLRWVLSHPETYADFAVIHLHRGSADITGTRG